MDHNIKFNDADIRVGLEATGHYSYNLLGFLLNRELSTFDKVNQHSKLKQSLSRLVTILFPELESAVSTLHSNSIYAMLMKYPSAKEVAKSQCHFLINLLESSSRARFGSDKAKEIRNLARKSVGVYFSAKALNLFPVSVHALPPSSKLKSEILIVFLRRTKF